jgi:hypothetical protein
MEYQDKTLICLDCFKEYIWTSGEQRFFASKNPPLQQPKRCLECRKRRRLTIDLPETRGD